MKLEVTLDDGTISALGAKLNGLKDFDKSQAVRSAFKRGADVFKRQGLLSFDATWKGTRHQRHSRFRWSFLVKNKLGKADALAGFGSYGAHGHLIDRGTKARYTKRGQYRGIMPASYFWTKTFNSYKGQVNNQIVKDLEREIKKRC